MTCPHCLVAIHESWKGVDLAPDADRCRKLEWALCPACSRYIFRLERVRFNNIDQTIIYPKQVALLPLPQEVPAEFASDYNEARLVLRTSQKASAALSRRCLQNLIREKAGIKKGDLANELQQVLDSNRLPSYLADAIDAVRVIGNFAAHPIKSQNTGAIMEVEPGEAEWLLETLEGLFDFYFVQPAKLTGKRDALNKKLQEAGKPPIKQPSP